MYRPILAAFLLLATVAAQSSSIGIEIPPIPAGCQSHESSMLGPTHKFAYSFLVCDGEYVVLLQKFVDLRGRNVVWVVLDELHVAINGSARELLGVPICESAYHKGEFIFGLGELKELVSSYEAVNISNAWRFNLENGKIEAIGTNGMSCTLDKVD